MTTLGMSGGSGANQATSGPFAFLSRRRLLKGALGGGALLLMGGGSLYWLRGSAPPVRGLRVLSDHEFRTLTAVADTHLPAGGAIAAGAKDAELARAFDSYLADEPEENVADLKRALLVVEYGPVVFDAMTTTFSNLDSAARLYHWQSSFESDLLIRRQVAVAFRKFLCLVFYDRPDVWPAIGYPGPSLPANAAAPALKTAPAPSPGDSR